MSAVKQLFDIANTLAGENVSKNYEHTFTGAFDALTDTLAGYDVERGKTISEAIKAAAPYISGGSGGGEEFEFIVQSMKPNSSGSGPTVHIPLPNPSQALRYQVDASSFEYVELTEVELPEPFGVCYKGHVPAGTFLDYSELKGVDVYDSDTRYNLQNIDVLISYCTDPDAMPPGPVVGMIKIFDTTVQNTNFDSGLIPIANSSFFIIIGLLFTQAKNG